jgi:hypothetical protein
MREPRFFPPWTVVLLIACVRLACGTSNAPNGQLQSVSISPAAANRQAQFTATGSYTGHAASRVVVRD